MVFQDYTRSLFPWLIIQKQLELAFIGSTLPHDLIQKKIENVLEITELTIYRNFFPKELSGGMQQKVSLARALVLEPKILFLDEPFGSLDAQSRYYLEDYLQSLVEKLDISIIFVTHDLDEAIYVSDRVVVFSQKPTIIFKEIITDLPRPRSQIDTKSLPIFLELRRDLFDRLYKNEK
jgi:NitT/TauT family transport system ATP-binding protein